MGVARISVEFRLGVFPGIEVAAIQILTGVGVAATVIVAITPILPIVLIVFVVLIGFIRGVVTVASSPLTSIAIGGVVAVTVVG